MKRFALPFVVVLAGCAAQPALEAARLASSSPEVASCAQWFQALDNEVEAAGVRDLQYFAVPGFPYLRTDRFLASSLGHAAADASAFAALADRMLDHDRESRSYEIANLPAASVEKWADMRLDDSRDAALHRSVRCGRLLREVELAKPELRGALLERAAVAPSVPPAAACASAFPRGAGTVVRFSPPPHGAARVVARWLSRAEKDPLGQPIISRRELDAVAAAYAPSFELVVASDADRFGSALWRRGASRLDIDAAQPAVYVRSSYAPYEGHALLQIIYTMLFPDDRITWRVTIAPDGEPLVYDASGPGGCYVAALTPRARLREHTHAGRGALPRLGEEERPLFAIAATSHAIEALGAVRGTDSLARYLLRPYDELRSLRGLDGRRHAAVGRPALDDADRLAMRYAFDLGGARP